MNSSHILKRMGFSDQDKLLIIHADDLGVCPSFNQAAQDALSFGLVTSTSLMVPAPAFEDMATWCLQHPQYDYGLHITLNSEFTGYRWSALTQQSEAPGIYDIEGYLPRTPEALEQSSTTQEIAIEIAAQIETLLQKGIQPSHLDCHCCALWINQPYFELYLQMARQYALLPLIPGPSPGILSAAQAHGIDFDAIQAFAKEAGFIIFDNYFTVHNSAPDFATHSDRIYQHLCAIPPGLNILITHLALPSENLEHITHNWQLRSWEYQIFTDEKTRLLLNQQNIQLISYKDLQAVRQTMY